MLKTNRRLRAEERREWNSFISFFNRKQWGMARAEADAGNAEVLEFEVVRAWFINDCGPDCCPTHWLLETRDGGFVSIDSWKYLSPVLPDGCVPWEGGLFPGSQVKVDRWPLTGRVIVAEAKGDPVPIEQTVPQLLPELPKQWHQCLLYEATGLPGRLFHELHSPRQTPPDQELT